VKAICLVVQSVYDFDPRVRRKAEALVAAGYSVDVLALRPADGRKQYTLNSVNVYTVSLGKQRGSLLRYLFEYGAFFAWVLVRVPLLMRHRHYAVIDVNTLPDFLIFAPIVARWMGASLVLDMHEITPEFYMSKYGIAEDSPMIRLLTWLEQISFRFADHVLTINEPILDLLVSRGLTPSKATVIMNAVDEARFTPLAKAPRSGDASERFVMMYHGTLTRTYGMDIAIEAFAIAHQHMPGAEMWILGSGPESGPLADLANECGLASKVKLFGQVAAREIPGWLSQCDMGILPFRRDVFLNFAFPNKLPEFIVAGKVVAIPRLKAVQHYFSEEALVYFEANSASALAEQMMRIYREEPLRRRMAAKAREEYAPIRWEIQKRAYLDLVGELAGVGQRATERTRPAEVSLPGVRS
jgi:glycosyltransferase involved in cell wall biosynthesis